MRWFSVLKCGLNFQANHFFPLLPPDPRVSSFAVCPHLRWGRSWQPVTLTSQPQFHHPLGLALTAKCLLQLAWCLKRTSSGMGGVFLFCPGKHRDLDALLDSGHPWVLLIPARARLCYSSYHLCHLHSQPPWGSLPPQVGGRDDPTSTNWDIMRNPWIRRMPHAKSLSHVRLFVTPWTVAHQAPLSMGFSRQEYWSRLPCSPPGDLPDPVIKPASFMSPGLASRFFTTSATWKGSCSVVSDSLQPHGLQPTRLLYGIFQVRATWEAPKGCCSSPKTTQSIPSEIFLNHS